MSTYRTVKGYSIKKVTGDPSNPKEGQVWYNSTEQKIKARLTIAAAWASGGNLNTARHAITGFGTQTAGLGAGGQNGPVKNESEEYNGTSWTEGNNLSSPRFYAGGAGTQTAALIFPYQWCL